MADPNRVPLPTLHLSHDADGRAHPGCRISVTIPAKDEADYIEATLAALQAQEDADGRPLDPRLYEVILLANNCSDRTAAVARAFGDRHPAFQLHVAEMVLPREIASVGVARKLMMDAAARRLPPDGIIAMTDADTLVDRHWIRATLQAFSQGARAVGGRIVVPGGDRTGYRKIHLQDVTYRSLQTLLESMVDPDLKDPWPRHFQHYGPSLAVSVEAYVACGGMPPVRCIEDAAFTWALERIDVHIVHDPAVRVYTSDRDSDRVEGVAFSHSLEEWTRMAQEGREPRVLGLQRCLDLYKWKVALRRAFHRRRIAGLPALLDLATYLALSPLQLQQLVGEASTEGALYQDIRQRVERMHTSSDTTFDRAIKDLRRFTRSARVTPSASRHPAGSVRRAVPLSDRSLPTAG